jgi:hypothetical protein
MLVVCPSCSLLYVRICLLLSAAEVEACGAGIVIMGREGVVELLVGAIKGLSGEASSKAAMVEACNSVMAALV